jgi:hypothetical protein
MMNTQEEMRKWQKSGEESLHIVRGVYMFLEENQPG